MKTIRYGMGIAMTAAERKPGQGTTCENILVTGRGWGRHARGGMETRTCPLQLSH